MDTINIMLTTLIRNKQFIDNSKQRVAQNGYSSTIPVSLAYKGNGNRRTYTPNEPTPAISIVNI